MAATDAKSETARSRSRAGWAARTEARSLTMPAALLKEAKTNTKAAASDVVFMARLAQEIAITRGPELTLAYRNLVWVLPGFRKCGRNGKARVTKEVCLVCVVRKKGTVAEDHRQHLPAFLTIYAERDGTRKLFAVPTDVQDERDYRGAKPHADSGIWVRNGSWPDEPGSFACLVRVTTGTSSRICALSAQHVFTPFPDGESLQVKGGLPVLPLTSSGFLANAPQLGLTLPYGGLMRSDEMEHKPSLDVQLADVTHAAMAQLTAARRFHTPEPWVRSYSELLLLATEAPFFLLPPDNRRGALRRGPIPLKLTGMPSRPVPIPYLFAGSPRAVRRDVYQAELVRFDAMPGSKSVPLGGDSGSAIVARRASGAFTLVAMHLAGDERGMSWALPAWQLFDTRYWRQYPTGARIEPMDL